jgi:NTE family protein
VVRMLAPRIDNENHTKDIDFTAHGIGARRQAGYEAAMEALERKPWEGDFDPIEGIILYEPETELAAAAE